MGAGETRRAIEAAGAGAPRSGGHAPRRSARGILRRLADLMLDHQEDLARLLVTEQGKPLAEARVEIEYAASFYEWFGEEAKRAYGDTIPSPRPDRRILVLKQPVGVAAGITPWNFPAAMPTRKTAPALAAGCTMVLKPAEQTPLSALAVAALAEEAGLPAGVLSVVTGDAEDAPAIGAEMTSNPLVRKLGFTGSTEVGKLLMRQCSAQLKQISLELGGNAPFIVFDDADLEAAVAGAMLCKFRNSGQTCITANRILVQDGVYDEFVERFTSAAAATDGRRRLHARRRCRAADRRICGREGRAPRERRGRARRRARARRKPPRGAVLPADGADGRAGRRGDELRRDVRPRRRTSRALQTRTRLCASANDTPYGLAAYFYSQSNARTWRVSRGARVRHRRDQHRLHLDRGRTVRWDEGVGHRPRGLEVRAGRVARAEVPGRRRCGRTVIVEQRDYHVYTGKLPELLRLYESEGIPMQQEILGGFVAAFTTDVGALSTYTTLWRYDSYAEREERRARLQADEPLAGLPRQVQPLMHTQQNRILVPTSFSPLR